MLPVNQQQSEDQQIPHAFIEKSGMDIDIIGAFGNMRGDIVRYVPGPHSVDRKLHRKQTVIILSEYFPVHKIPPPSDCLSQNQPGHAGIPHQQGILLLDPAVDKERDKSRYDPSVDRQAAVSQSKYPHQIILIKIPRKDHIINTRADNGKNHRIDGKIPIIIRILPCHLRNMSRHHDPGQHTHPDQQSVKCNVKSEYTE